MRTKLTGIFICVLPFFIVTSQTAHAQVGITGVPFLQIEPDSRAAGMGNSNVAIADNASAIFWNPAGLAFQKGSQLSITHANWLPNFDAGLFYDYLVGKYYIDGLGTFAGHITFLNLGEQVQTDEIGNEIGKFSSYDFAVGASYGFDITPDFAIGIGTRFIYSNLVPEGTETSAQVQASAGTSLAFDLGFLYKSPIFMLGENKANINFGLNASNIGTAIQYTDEQQKDPLPTMLRAGFAFTTELDPDGYNKVTVSADVSKIMADRTVEQVPGDTSRTRNVVTPSIVALFTAWKPITFTPEQGKDPVTLSVMEQLMIGGGLEYWYADKFALRGGYFYENPNNGNRQFITLGAGIRYDIIGVDFSYIYTIQERHPLEGTIRFSLLVDFR
ncbi:type IX secretion system outer membrane channel protein PorV [bacterium]|nr:MAG: type IX secretion system outer membrane channel protein PorV [bacterium]